MLWRQSAGERKQQPRLPETPGHLACSSTGGGGDQCDGGGGPKEGAAGGHGKGVESWDFGAHKML